MRTTTFILPAELGPFTLTINDGKQDWQIAKSDDKGICEINEEDLKDCPDHLFNPTKYPDDTKVTCLKTQPMTIRFIKPELVDLCRQATYYGRSRSFIENKNDELEISILYITHNYWLIGDLVDFKYCY
jgi:hypothetical protein